MAAAASSCNREEPVCEIIEKRTQLGLAAARQGGVGKRRSAMRVGKEASKMGQQRHVLCAGATSPVSDRAISPTLIARGPRWKCAAALASFPDYNAGRRPCRDCGAGAVSRLRRHTEMLFSIVPGETQGVRRSCGDMTGRSNTRQRQRLHRVTSRHRV